MSYREIPVSVGGCVVEVFVVRVDDLAVEAWIESRSRLSAAGCPDRPPDAATSRQLAWVMREGELESWRAYGRARRRQFRAATYIVSDSAEAMVLTTLRGDRSRPGNAHPAIGAAVADAVAAGLAARGPS
jgi:hypothetical protein